MKAFDGSNRMQDKQKIPFLQGLLDVIGFSRTPMWWRRRELNPRPLILRLKLYMCSRVFKVNQAPPDGQGKMTGEPYDLTVR